jgi:thymidylate synthase
LKLKVSLQIDLRKDNKMKVFKANNTTEMAKKVYLTLEKEGVKRDSRNGRVITLPYPVGLEYTNPLKRCNFTPGRDANPVFHHMEAIWMLAGRRDVDFLTMFNSNMVNYSDDGAVFNAAYGHRMRYHFGHDQIEEVIEILRAEPDSRQAIVQLWDHQDLTKETKDKACNMLMAFSINHLGHVNLTVYNRSNDAVFGGVSGANPVHFSYFLEYVAQKLGRPVGSLYFFVNNLHVYLDLYDHWDKMNWLANPVNPPHYSYQIGDIEELRAFCQSTLETKEIITHQFESDMLNKLSVPMWNYWCSRKFKKSSDTQRLIDNIEAPDWHLAISIWDMRRRNNESS